MGRAFPTGVGAPILLEDLRMIGRIRPSVDLVHPQVSSIARQSPQLRRVTYKHPPRRFAHTRQHLAMAASPHSRQADPSVSRSRAGGQMCGWTDVGILDVIKVTISAAGFVGVELTTAMTTTWTTTWYQEHGAAASRCRSRARDKGCLILGVKCATRGLRQEAVSSMVAPSAARCTASQPFLATAFVS
jgi:hypothetical protein